MSSCSNSFSPPFVVPQQFADQKIKTILIFDVKADNVGLKIMNARHCYSILILETQKKVKVEAGKNKQDKIQISYQQAKLDDLNNRKLVQINVSDKYLRLKDIGIWLKSRFQGMKYIVTDYNCYYVCQKILSYCGFSNQAKIVHKKLSIQNRKGFSGVICIQGAVFGTFVGGPVGLIIGGAIGKVIGWGLGKIIIQQ